MRTFQLRRYELDPELAEEFVNWVNSDVIPVREGFGYQVHWQYFDRANSQLIWLVSLEANETEFVARDQIWMSSPERAEVVLKMPKALIQAHVSFVEKI